MSKKDLDKDKAIRKEFNRLRRIFKDIPDDRKKTVLETLKNAAFQSYILKELQDSILEEGTMTEYQNGENQWGFKQNPDVTTYNSIYQRYMQSITLLLNQLPRDSIADDNPFSGLNKPQ